MSLAGLGLRALKPIGPDFTRPWAVASSPEALIELTRRRNLLAAEHMRDICRAQAWLRRGV